MAESRIDKKAKEFMPPKGKDLIQWLDKKREEGKKKLPERQMKLNLAFMLGEQWLSWDPGQRTYRRPVNRVDDPNAPVRITANKIGSIAEHYIARLLKANPEPEARPVGDQQKDVDAAKVATRILLSELNRVEWSDLQLDLFFWLLPLGFSYMQLTWDPDSGDYVGDDPETGEPVYGGNIDFDVVPGFELAVDPSGRRRDLSDSRWAVRTVTMTPEAAWERWGVVLHGDNTSERTLAEEVLDISQRLSDQTQRVDQVRVHQFWLRPGSRMAPKGMVVTWSGETILEGPMDFPYEHGNLPFVQWDVLPGMGTREGRTWMSDLIPLQADYNDARSREAVIRRTLVPKLLYPVGSIDPKKLTTRVEAIGYNPVGEAPRLEIPDGRWMAQYEGAMERADAEMGERSGQNDLNSGDIQPSMPAAAILALQEGDDTKLAVPAKLNARATERVGVMILDLVREFWDEDRVVRTWSEDGYLEVQHFTGAEIQDQLDIHVSSESALPRSKASRAQLAMELNAQGFFQGDPRKFVRMLDVPGVDQIVAEWDLDAKQQKRETNRMLEQGITLPVNTWDNHMIHYNEINDFRKGEDYDFLPPEMKAVIDAHADAHLMLLMGQMQAGANPSAPSNTPEHYPVAPQVGQVGEGGTGGSEYLNPLTSSPSTGGPSASGDQQNPLQGSRMGNAQGIGGVGNPGPVPGVPPDTQAARMGN